MAHFGSMSIISMISVVAVSKTAWFLSDRRAMAGSFDAKEERSVLDRCCEMEILP